MKIAIVSDTHGSWQSVREALQAEEGLEQLFFLGDMAADGQNSPKRWNCLLTSCGAIVTAGCQNPLSLQ